MFPPSSKRSGWQELLNSYKKNNPYTTEDENLRKYVRARIEYWKRKREEPQPTPTPVKYANPFAEKINRKAKRIYKNKEGYWEAEFDYGIIMVYISAGEFTMGSSEYYENPVHKVYLDGYWIGKYEVTFEQYDRYCEKTGKKKPGDEGWGRGKLPVIHVSWYETTAYCEWLSKKTGLKFRLPTEAEWEKAARGTDGLIYPWGNKFDKNKCNSLESSLKKTTPVGNFPGGVSPYGCLDMAGNVYEWCSDWYNGNYYKDSPYRNPKGPASGSYLVVHGGSWFINAFGCQASDRGYYHPTNRSDGFGFRLAGSL